MHHYRQRRCAVPIIGQEDIIFAIAELAGDVTAAGLGGGRGSEENTEEKQKYKVSHQRNSKQRLKSAYLFLAQAGSGIKMQSWPIKRGS